MIEKSFTSYFRDMNANINQKMNTFWSYVNTRLSGAFESKLKAGKGDIDSAYEKAAKDVVLDLEKTLDELNKDYVEKFESALDNSVKEYRAKLDKQCK